MIAFDTDVLTGILLGRGDDLERASAIPADQQSVPQQTLGRDINPVVYSMEEVRSKLEDGHHFLTTVVADEKIFVIGTQNELGELLA